jgi:predicted esterase YcpF (UPF0227 family)
MELSAILEIIKHLPESASVLVIGAAIIFSLYYKRKDTETAKIIAINEMQNKQLTQLLNQNSDLSDELRKARTELRDAYEIIADMRIRVESLEKLIKNQGE